MAKDTCIFDIELSPNLAYVYGKYETNVIEFERYQWVQSVSFKWLGEDKIHTYAQPDFPVWKKDRFDDSGPLKKLHEAICKATIVVGHNIKKFDIKKANTRFLINGLDPPRPYKVIDTLTIARSKFGFVGNSLNDLAIQMEIGKKLDKGVPMLWKACMNGDKTAWKHMKAYNAHDVILTEKIYKKMLPWIDSFPIVHLSNGKCRKCQSDMQKRGFYYTKTGQYQRYQCLNCGSWEQGEMVDK